MSTTLRLLISILIGGLFTGCVTVQKGPFWSVVTYAGGEVYVLAGDEIRTSHPLIPRHASDKPWTWPSKRALRVTRQTDGIIVLDGATHNTSQLGGLTSSHYNYFPTANLVTAQMETARGGTNYIDLRSGKTIAVDAAFRDHEVNAQRPFTIVGKAVTEGYPRKYSYSIFNMLNGTSERLSPEASAFIGPWLAPEGDPVCSVSFDGTVILRGAIRVPRVLTTQKTATLVASAWDVRGNRLLMEATPLALAPFHQVNPYEIHRVLIRNEGLVVFYGEPAKGSLHEVIFCPGPITDRSLWSDKGKFRSVRVHEESANVVAVLGEVDRSESPTGNRHFELERFDVASGASLQHRMFTVQQDTRPY